MTCLVQGVTGLCHTTAGIFSPESQSPGEMGIEKEMRSNLDTSELSNHRLLKKWSAFLMHYFTFNIVIFFP